MNHRLVSHWKEVVFLLGAVVATVISLGMWVESVASPKWQALDRRVAELRAELEVLRGARPVLRGTPIPGKAWDDYVRAVSALKNADAALLQDFVDRKSSQWDRGTVQRAIGDQAAALEFLRAGARRAESGTPRLPRGMDGGGLDRPKVKAQDLAHLAISRSRFLIEEGRAQEAVELLMDLSQFGQDVRRLGKGGADYEGDFVFHQALREIKDLVVSGPLPPVVLVQLDQELGILDAASPREKLRLLHDLETTGSELLDGTYDEKEENRLGISPLALASRSWRYGFSRRLAAAEKFDHFDTWVREVVAAEAAAWPEENQVCARAREEDTEDLKSTLK